MDYSVVVDPFPTTGKNNTMIQAINYIPVGGNYTDPVELSPQTQATSPDTIFTPKNIMIGTAVICIAILILKK
jgi:hypothetical protein